MYIINPKEYKNIFAVPSSVTEKHIKTAGTLSLKVLLLISSKPETTPEELAQILNISVADVHDAANFWIANDVLLTLNTDKVEKNTLQKSDAPIKRVSQAPVRLSGKELEARVNESENVRFLISETERHFGKNLIPSEAAVLISLFDWAGLPVDILLMIISYCASINKTNMRFVEKLALDWIDKGIDSHDLVVQHIKELTNKNANESAIKTAFGIFNRSLTTKEKNFINNWFNQLGFTAEMIQLAYEKTIDSTGNLSFPYINTILTSWNQKGIKTPAQAMEEMNADKKAAKKSTATPSYDLDGIDKLITDKIV